MKYFVILFLIGFFTSCVTPKITYDFDDTTNFGSFKTYKISNASSLELKQLDSLRLIQAFNKVLAQNKLYPSDTPDLLIVITRTAEETQNNAQIGIGMAQQTRHLGINIGGAIPIKRHATTQSITIDFRTVNSNRLVWQSHLTNTYKNDLSPDGKSDLFINLFQKVFKGYPPLVKK